MNNFKICFRITFAFLIIGTFLFILQLFFRGITLITIIGYYYVIFSLILNSIAVILLFTLLFVEENTKEILKSIGVLLINIPIAYLYFYIVTTYSI